MAKGKGKVTIDKDILWEAWDKLGVLQEFYEKELERKDLTYNGRSMIRESLAELKELSEKIRKPLGY